MKVSGRGLFKRKIEAFSEKKYQNNEFKKGRSGGAGRSNGAANSQEVVSYEVAACVTEQRLAKALSKTGRVDPRNKSACRQLLADLKVDVHEALDDGDRQVLLNSPELQDALDQQCKELITS